MRNWLTLLLLAPLFGVGPQPTSQDALDAYRAELASLARDGSWWLASNAEHLAEDGGTEAYATRFWLELGGVSASGCLWSVRDGNPVAVHWHFVQGWDGARGRPFYYQTHASGSTGMGEETYRSDGVAVTEQEFWWTDGTRERTLHRTEWRDSDSYVTRSAALVAGDWMPRRTYTWIRQPAGPTPCGPPADARDAGLSPAG